MKEAKEKTKKVHWVFDKDSGIMSVDTATSVKADLEGRFKFKLVIYKDAETHIENIKITNYKDGQENGSIVTSIFDLGKDLRTFKRFGVVIGDTYFRDLARRIEKEYANIEIGEVTLSKSDTRYEDLIEEIKRYFAEYKEDDYVTKDFCNIPVNSFNGLASDCGYSEYEMKNLRSRLAQDKYIHDVKAIDRPTYSIYKGNPNENLMNGVFELLDEYERAEIAMKLKRGRKKKAELGGL